MQYLSGNTKRNTENTQNTSQNRYKYKMVLKKVLHNVWIM